MIGIDTNVILGWVMRDVPAQAAAADAFFEGLSAESPGFVGQATMFEIHAVLRRRYRVPQGEVLDVLEQLLRSEALEFDDGESLWRALVLAREGADFPDALIADTAEMFGCEQTVTFDRDAARLPGMRLLV